MIDPLPASFLDFFVVSSHVVISISFFPCQRTSILQEFFYFFRLISWNKPASKARYPYGTHLFQLFFNRSSRSSLHQYKVDDLVISHFLLRRIIILLDNDLFYFILKYLLV